MTFPEKFDKVITGLISGLVLPFIVGLIIYLFSHGHISLSSYLARILDANIITHSITICVFSNIFVFLIFNRFDMLRASRGVLAMTIIWAVIVFGVKLF
ncbi:MAG TPA: hypothetical protein VMV77_20240 [Bacteroidales bacterium]|nr:hypothetical protein [Bacteroidales bacterium]